VGIAHPVAERARNPNAISHPLRKTPLLCGPVDAGPFVFLNFAATSLCRSLVFFDYDPFQPDATKF
jgi:hypothetical protein